MASAEEVLHARRAADPSASSRGNPPVASPEEIRVELVILIERELTAAGNRLAAAVPAPYPGGRLLYRWLGGTQSEQVAVWHVHQDRNGPWYTRNYYFSPTLGVILADQTAKAMQDAGNITQQRTDPVYHNAVRRGLLMTIRLADHSSQDLGAILTGLRLLEA